MRFLFLLLTLSLIPAMSGAVEAAGNIYEVKNVSVTAPGTDAAKTREIAMDMAQKKAFDELQGRLLTGGNIKKKQEVAPARITTAVQAVDVVSEKITTKDYRASYNVIFSPGEISKIFGIGKIEPVKEVEKFLLIPVIIDKGTVKIWKNDWWKIWGDESYTDIILPLGDLQDIKNFKDEDYKNNKFSGLLKLNQRYGTNSIVIVQAEYLPPKNSLEVQLQKIKGDNKTIINYEYPGDDGIGQQELLEAAVNDISFRLENDKLTDENLTTTDNGKAAKGKSAPLHESAATKAKAPEQAALPPLPKAKPADQGDLPPLPKAKPVATTAATADISHTDIFVNSVDLIAWNRVRNKIVGTAGVMDLQIKSFTAGRAYISIGHNGDIASIKSALSAQGLDLIGDGQNYEIRERN